VKRGLRILVATAVVGATVAGGYAVDAATPDTAPPLGPGLVTVEVDIHHSRFDLDGLRVRPGTTVEFVVRNHDPINHELVIGPAAVHARHDHGTEREHPPVPGEVSVAPQDTGLTFYEFEQPGAVRFACHLPGHVAFGMEGEIVVTDS
jgi:uncharacterized cupredoxin-like copper-binding protein